MNKSIELLSPAGDFDCLKAAVQNGADSVYFGADMFSARASATNFSLDNLQEAITYAKLRNVHTHLTLNTLIKNNELSDAISIAKTAYEYGIDAIIVQDLGLANYLIHNFPDLPIHASTQMTIYNLEGALLAEKLGFSRAVLSRELSISEIEYICKNSNIEIETFIHGALCISYSGQCLFSSMIGGRSGNRGKCAQPCRLPYSLIKSESNSNYKETLDSGYLLSTRDVCGLDFIPKLIKAGVKCFKIEGRMKTPEYVAAVTKIYRKYIDLALSGKPYIVDYADKKILMQVFNRGGFSSGHLENEYNKDLVFTEKPNNMGLLLGTVKKFNPEKGHIDISANEILSIGDTISLEKESGTYTISELMVGNSNIEESLPFQPVTIGRMKGNISVGDKVYKMSSKELTRISLDSINKENIKKGFDCILKIKKDEPITMTVINTTDDPDDVFSNIYFTITSPVKPVSAINAPITHERVISQITKTKNTPFYFEHIEIDLDDNIFIPSIGCLNELHTDLLPISFNNNDSSKKMKKSIAVLFNNFNRYFDYSLLEKVDKIYIPYKYFIDANYFDILKTLTKKINTYIYLPTVSKNFMKYNFDKILSDFSKIKGFVLSNISHLKLLEKYSDKYEFIANYTFNIFNDLTLNDLQKYGISTCTLSPELSKDSLLALSDKFQKELIVYGNIPLMNTRYCLLGKSNSCYPECTTKCTSSNTYELKDRLNMKFKILPDNTQTITTIFNCKTLSITPEPFNIDFARIDILDENIDTINNIVYTVLNNKRCEGKDFTNGNLNREI